jgi:hypothetical protein
LANGITNLNCDRITIYNNIGSKISIFKQKKKALKKIKMCDSINTTLNSKEKLLTYLKIHGRYGIKNLGITFSSQNRLYYQLFASQKTFINQKRSEIAPESTLFISCSFSFRYLWD